ncbi:hypothetical protein, partial [Bradyrhizobium campsiandrae]|uniref:hypothetical protein n=1 Tax=Bradyrhizobium campsiandrae TaxID=1729892 RepID=UPI001AEE7424
APAGSSTITDPFTKYDPITSTFLMGTASNLPGDPPGQDHLVLGITRGQTARAGSEIIPQGRDEGRLENIGKQRAKSDVLSGL